MKTKTSTYRCTNTYRYTRYHYQNVFSLDQILVSQRRGACRCGWDAGHLFPETLCSKQAKHGYSSTHSIVALRTLYVLMIKAQNVLLGARGRAEGIPWLRASLPAVVLQPTCSFHSVFLFGVTTRPTTFHYAQQQFQRTNQYYHRDEQEVGTSAVGRGIICTSARV